MKAEQDGSKATRSWIARGFTVVEDIVYVGLGLLLSASAIVLLVSGIINFVRSLATGTFLHNIVGLLDNILLILLIVELLYTVQVSFRKHALLPEPFLLVGLIAAIRRVLVLTAEFGQKTQETEMFKNFLIELVVLTGLILAVTISLVLLRRHRQELTEHSRVS
jgi:uncharacterized membrane protein (DUF373 family)